MSTLGIDLGTTHTVLARAGRALHPKGRTPIVPSAMSVPPDGPVLVGRRALDRRAIDPEQTILSSKRLIGRPFVVSWRDEFQSYFGPRLTGTGSNEFGFRTRLGVFSPTHVAGQIVSYAAHRAGVVARDTTAIVTVPAAFDQRQRSATRDAIRGAGFPAIGVIDEPVATAIAYLQRSNLRYAAVYDFGGGTFDLAIVDCHAFPFRVLAYDGDPFLGGDDVDEVLAKRVAGIVLREHRWDLGSDRSTWRRLVSACEWAKRTLATRDEVGIPITEIDPAAPQNIDPVPMTREVVEHIGASFVHKTFALCDAALSKARVPAQQMDAVFLAGGSTMLPGLHELVGTYFGKRPRFDLDPMHVVALGASYAAVRPDLHKLLDQPIARRPQSRPDLIPS